MDQAGKFPLTKPQRRNAFFLAYVNGELWALGNGLGSTALIVYLVKQLGAAGLGIGAILAAPHIAGVLRLAAPRLLLAVGSRKMFCTACYGLSALLLTAISQLAEPGRVTSASVTLSLVVSLWCVFHLLEYAGTVVLWAWLGEIAPQRIRGRFIGMRERHMLVARIVGMLAAAGFSWWWETIAAPSATWIGYSLTTCAAAACMMTAVLPLLRMPQFSLPSQKPVRPLKGLLRPLGNRNMRWLIMFGVWYSLANGLTQSAQYLFPIVVLNLLLLTRLNLNVVMRLGQVVIATPLGRAADRIGNRPVLIVCQLFVALGPLFFLFANHGIWAWVCGAWVAWVAYAGLNIALPNMMLKLAGPDSKASYVAWYFAATGVVYGLATIAGGAFYAWLSELGPAWIVASIKLDYHDALFATGFVLRALAVLWLLPIRE